MRRYISTILMLFAGIYTLEKFIFFSTEKFPKSRPTPVELFMDEIAKIESPNDDYTVVNRYGMMGRYQFSPQTVRGLGFRVTKQQFLRDKNLQDTVMFKYMKENYRELRHLIDRYNGKTVGGVKITRASILAAAHFAGSSGVKVYFASNGNSQVVDGNGTTIKQYMSKFSNFALPPLKL